MFAGVAAAASALSYWMALHAFSVYWNGDVALGGMVVFGILAGVGAAAAVLPGFGHILTDVLGFLAHQLTLAVRSFVGFRISNDDTVSRATWSILAGSRMFFALVVVCSHMSIFAAMHDPFEWLHRLNGLDAVLVFLFISGFSIAHSSLTTSKGYLKRRLWRIMPVYLVSMAISTLPYLIHTGATAPNFGIKLSGSIRDMIWHIVPIDVVGVPAIWSNPVTWSLSVEMAMYCLAPLLRRIPASIILGVTLYSANWYMTTPYHKHIHLFGHALVDYGWAWLAGYLYYAFRTKLWAQPLTLLNAYCITHYSLYDYPSGIVMCEAFGVMMIGLNFLPKWTLGRTVSRGLDWLGDISYPLYMIHFPVMWCGWLLLGTTSCFLYLVLAMLVASAVYYAVDYRRQKRKLSRVAVEPLTAVT